MNDWIVRDVNTGDEWHKDSRQECEQAVDEFGSVRDLEIIPPDSEASNGTEEASDANTTDVVETTPDGGQAATVTNTQPDDVVDVPDEGPSLDENPTDWLPGHFIDEIQGVPTVNRKGYCMIASKYGVSVTAEPVTTASESGFEYAEFRAIATTEDGKEYSGFGSAHVDRQDGDDAHLLNELAETRALKRACAWATGIGLTAIEELKNEL